MGPINTFNGWNNLGRSVKKGEKALSLVMPIIVKDKESKEEIEKMFFIEKRNWFVMSQTEGEDFSESVPDWNMELCLTKMNVKIVPFKDWNGNVMGYCEGREIAINPVNPHPYHTVFHELAHIHLGHTDKDNTIPKNVKEMMSEAVALCCIESFHMDGSDECRGYIQTWAYNEGFSYDQCMEIVKCADHIIKAGYSNEN